MKEVGGAEDRGEDNVVYRRGDGEMIRGCGVDHMVQRSVGAEGLILVSWGCWEGVVVGKKKTDLVECAWLSDVWDDGDRDFVAMGGW